MTPDPAAQVEAVLDILAPKPDVDPEYLAVLGLTAGVRVPVIRFDFEGRAVMPSDGQIRALAEQIVTAIRTAHDPAPPDPPSTAAAPIVQFEWSRDDQAFAAVLLRDGQPWYLGGALVGMGATREEALTDLTGLARYLVIHGDNCLTADPLPLADREWLFGLLDHGSSDDEMYAALHQARETAQEGGTP